MNRKAVSPLSIITTQYTSCRNIFASPQLTSIRFPFPDYNLYGYVPTGDRLKWAKALCTVQESHGGLGAWGGTSRYVPPTAQQPYKP